MPTLRDTAAGAVGALQAWYQADPYAENTGLYHWDDPDLSVELGGAAAASAIVALGYRNAAQDTLRWWNSANAITALIDYMSITGDTSYAWVIDETFTQATQAWQPKVGAIKGWTLVGTDDKLWKVFNDGSSQSQVGSNTTSSTPVVTADGWVYFRGTDNKLWKVFNDGTQESQIGDNKTASTPCVSAAGPPPGTGPSTRLGLGLRRMGSYRIPS